MKKEGEKMGVLSNLLGGLFSKKEKKETDLKKNPVEKNGFHEVKEEGSLEKEPLVEKKPRRENGPMSRQRPRKKTGEPSAGKENPKKRRVKERKKSL